MAFAIPCRLRLLAHRGWKLAAALFVLGTSLAHAAQDIYSVAGVPVDVTAETVIEARELAVEQGQREGLRLLLQRLTTSEFYNRLPDVSTIDIAPLVRSFGVENEALSADQYIAEVAATYDGAGIQRLLQGRGVPIVLEASPPLLIVPARRVDGRLLMFEATDAWTAAWSRGFNRNTLMDVVLPVGDLLDITRLPSNATGDVLQSGLAALAERYDTQAAVLLIADGDPQDGGTLRILDGGNYRWNYDFLGFSLSGSDETAWPQAVAGSLRRLEGPWKSERLVRFDNVEELIVNAPLADLASWAHIQKALGLMPEVQNVDLRAFSQSEAVLRIKFVGGLTQLQRSLENRGLRLAEETGQWQLQRAGSLQAG